MLKKLFHIFKYIWFSLPYYFVVLLKKRKLKINTNRGDIIFYCEAMKVYFRGISLLYKEPITVGWINTFKEKEIFWDIGASTGLYSLYAAKKNKIKVLAFEPMLRNFINLNQNIIKNNLGEQISAFCIALTDRDISAKLYSIKQEAGLGGTNFVKDNDKKEKGQKVFSETLGFKIDTLCYDYNLSFPNHLKIDVRGDEMRTLLGAKKILSDKRLKSIIIESDNLADQIKFKNFMSKYKFYQYSHKKIYNSYRKEIYKKDLPLKEYHFKILVFTRGN